MTKNIDNEFAFIVTDTHYMDNDVSFFFDKGTDKF